LTPGLILDKSSDSAAFVCPGQVSATGMAGCLYSGIMEQPKVRKMRLIAEDMVMVFILVFNVHLTFGLIYPVSSFTPSFN